MKKILLVALFLTGTAWAEEKPAQSVVNKTGAGLMGWFKNLREGLRESAVSSRQQKGRVTAVAAVRGSAQGDELASVDSPTMSEPGKTRKAKQLKKEKEALDKAASLAEEGKLDDSMKAFADFEARYPKSQYLDQVKLAQENLKVMSSQQAAAAEEANGGGSATPASEPSKQ
jgi:TolA-binding protein